MTFRADIGADGEMDLGAALKLRTLSGAVVATDPVSADAPTLTFRLWAHGS